MTAKITIRPGGFYQQVVQFFLFDEIASFHFKIPVSVPQLTFNFNLNASQNKILKGEN